MKYSFLKYAILAALFINCSTDDDVRLTPVKITMEFSHTWDGEAVTESDFNDLKYTNENGEILSIERLRYLISEINATTQDGTVISLGDYNLVDIANSSGLIYELPQSINPGTYTLSCTFGFSVDNNTDGLYPDLNTASWNVPMQLGGGYHFMQLDGKFLDATNTETNYNYHTIRAVNATDPTALVFQETAFEIPLGTLTIENDLLVVLEMNIAAWFKHPHTWNLNEQHSMLMPNFDAQVRMAENGQDVFSYIVAME